MWLSLADPGMDYRLVFSALLNGLETPEIDVVRAHRQRGNLRARTAVSV